MMKIAEIFGKRKVGVDGDGTWVLLFCDNLKARVNYQVQNFLDMQICSCIKLLKI